MPARVRLEHWKRANSSADGKVIVSEFGKTENGASDLVMVQVAGGDVLLLGAKAVVIFEAWYDIEVWIR